MSSITQNKSLTVYTVGGLEAEASVEMVSHVLYEIKREDTLRVTEQQYIPFHAVDHVNETQIAQCAVVGTAIVGQSQVG